MRWPWAARLRADRSTVVHRAFGIFAAALAFTLNAAALAQTIANDDPVAGYREAIDQAVAEYEAGNFEEARALFNRAHGLYPNARTLRGLGMVEYELKRYVESIAFLEDALESQVRPLDPELRAHTEALLARAERFVARYELVLRPWPTGVRIALDGLEIDDAKSGPLTVAIGDHVLLVRAEGYQEEKRALSVTGGERESLVIALQPMRTAPPLATSIAPPKRDESSSAWSSPWLWTGIGAVVAGGVIAAVLIASDGDDDALEGGDIGGVVTTLRSAP